AGRFREDLLFRLNTVEIRLPALRDRRQDIPLLAAHFLRRYAARYHKTVSDGFASDAMELLLRHSWPGNVRELDHAVERAVLISGGYRRDRASVDVWFHVARSVDIGRGGGHGMAPVRAGGARARHPAAADGIERAGCAARARLHAAGPWLQSRRCPRTAALRAEQSRRRHARAASRRARGHRAAAARHGRDRCRDLCVRFVANVTSGESQWRGVARSSPRAAAGPGRGKPWSRRKSFRRHAASRYAGVFRSQWSLGSTPRDLSAGRFAPRAAGAGGRQSR